MKDPQTGRNFWKSEKRVIFGGLGIILFLFIISHLHIGGSVGNQLFNSANGMILFVLNFPIKMWVVSTGIVIYWAIRRLKERNRRILDATTIQEPKFLQYKKDVLIKWLWAWDYEILRSSNHYVVVNLNPVCKIDETPLIKQSDDSYTCPHCNTTFGDNLGGEFSEPEDHVVVLKLIEDNIRKIMNDV
ncbi:MAG TPA: hypothetical protein VNX40_06600 [Mucilaginibacter sp.]|jgi:hypothetical protein|nr:hypothetical protein [Mucilaginibacter sp.]